MVTGPMKIAATASPGVMPVSVPTGFAPGFITLADDCEVDYMMGEIFVAEPAAGWRRIAIEWQCLPPIIAERDANSSDFVR
jgi:dTDP-4-dehydrorhamnose 3,5-epimerase-like enzyme